MCTLICALPWSTIITVQAAREHQVDANSRTLAETQTSTRRTAAGRTRSKDVSPGRSEHITSTSNGSSTLKPAEGKEAKGTKNKVDQARRPGVKKEDSIKSGSSARSSSEDNAMMACPFPSGRFRKWRCVRVVVVCGLFVTLAL